MITQRYLRDDAGGRCDHTKGSAWFPGGVPVMMEPNRPFHKRREIAERPATRPGR